MLKNPRARFGAIFHPERYHGHGPVRAGGFFEGWYFKLVDANRRVARAVIPGVFHGPDPHAFIQVLDGETGASHYHRFPYEAFVADRHGFRVSIGPNHFSGDGLSLDLEGEDPINGSVRFSKVRHWPKSLVSPGIMGPFSFIPFMECCHGILSLDHEITGSLVHRGITLPFDGGRGYTEKDWGRSFPRAWIWAQTNHFKETGVSLTASVAIIPWLGSSFVGFIVGFLHRGHLYRFATYTGARLAGVHLDDATVTVRLLSPDHSLSLTATRARGGLLHGPMRGNTRTSAKMEPRVMESLHAEIHVTLTHRKTGAVLFDDTGARGGLEVGGDAKRLLKS